MKRSICKRRPGTQSRTPMNGVLGCSVGLVALFGRCYNALTIWPIGNRLPPGSAALALEKTLQGSSPTFIKKPATPWSLSSWPSSLRRPGRAAKQPNGIPPPQSGFAAPTGGPRPRKLLYAWEDSFPWNRRLHPLLPRLAHPLSPLRNRACHLNRPPRPGAWRALSRPPRKVPLPLSPTLRNVVHAAAAVAVAATDARSLLPEYQDLLQRPSRKPRFGTRVLHW